MSRVVGEKGSRWWRMSYKFILHTAQDSWLRRESTSTGRVMIVFLYLCTNTTTVVFLHSLILNSQIVSSVVLNLITVYICPPYRWKFQVSLVTGNKYIQSPTALRNMFRPLWKYYYTMNSLCKPFKASDCASTDLNPTKTHLPHPDGVNYCIYEQMF